MNHPTHIQAAVIGGGPAGLMAAETLLGQGLEVHLYDAMPAVARKLVVAGQSNLSLTRSQSFSELVASYGERADRLRPYLQSFGPEELREWAAGLGVETFVGSTGQVFPTDMTSELLLSRWLTRLEESGLVIHTRHRWQGWDDSGALVFHHENDTVQVTASAVVLALGGGSWPQLGSTGEWLSALRQRGVAVQPLQPANCGFDADFSSHFRDHFQGQPIKNVVLTISADGEVKFRQRGECLVTATGFEGSLLYSCVPLLRSQLAADGEAVVHLDLCPDRSLDNLAENLGAPRANAQPPPICAKRLASRGSRLACSTSTERGRTSAIRRSWRTG